MLNKVRSKKYWGCTLIILAIAVVGRIILPDVKLFEWVGLVSIFLVVGGLVIGIGAIFMAMFFPRDLLDKDAPAVGQAIPKIAKDLKADTSLPKLTLDHWESIISLMTGQQLRPLVLDGKPIEAVQNDIREEIAGIDGTLIEPEQGVALVEAYSRYFAAHPNLFLEAQASAKPRTAWEYFWKLSIFFIATGLLASIFLRGLIQFLVIIVVAILFVSVYIWRIVNFIKRKRP